VTDTTTTTTAEPAGTEGTTPPAVPTPPAPSAPAATELPEWAKDPAAAAKMVADLRAENARDRTAAKEAAKEEARQDLLKSLGLVKDDQPLDPAQAARDLQAKDSTIRELQVRSALSEALADAKAKPLARAAILGEGILSDLDPTASDFAAQVAAKVADYVGRNPELRATQAAAASAVRSSRRSGPTPHSRSSARTSCSRPWSPRTATSPRSASARSCTSPTRAPSSPTTRRRTPRSPGRCRPAPTPRSP
jgi:hypothetical protein